MCIFNPNKTWLKNYSLKKYKHIQQKRMSKNYLESEPGFNFVINAQCHYPESESATECKSKSEYESESDSSSAFMNLDICIFFTLYLHSSK